jgi:hypothetical protein
MSIVIFAPLLDSFDVTGLSSGDDHGGGKAPAAYSSSACSRLPSVQATIAELDTVALQKQSEVMSGATMLVQIK